MNKHHIYGIHAVEAALKNPKRKVYKLYVNQERQDARLSSLLQQVESDKIQVQFLSSTQIKQRFPDISHQGIVAEVSALEMYTETDITQLLEALAHPPFILILDEITDPHNLGACLRSADAAGVDFIIIPKDNSATITPVVSKVACGAEEAVPLIRVTNLARTLEYLKQQGLWIYGATEEGPTSIYSIDAKGPIAIILGREGKGLRRLTKDHCDFLFSIPMHGQVSSLNVSVATGICLYEVVRQRGDGSVSSTK